MKSNFKKHGGFGLIEIVISMAILSIMSIAIYDGLMIIIKQTKAGQVKQAAALEGKKIIEAMQATSFGVSGNELDLGKDNLGNNITFQEGEDAYGNIVYTRTSGNYVETVTLTPTKSHDIPQTTQQSVELDTNGTLNSGSNKLYISKINSQDYIGYWKYNSINQYTPANDSSTVPIPSNSQSQIEMSVYFTTDNNGNQIIDIKDYTGSDLLSIQSDNDLVINFSNYINSDGSVPTNDDIELDVTIKQHMFLKFTLKNPKN